MTVKKHNNAFEPLDTGKITKSLLWAAGNKYKHLVPEIEIASKLQFYDGISTSYIHDILIKTTRDLSSLRKMGMDFIAKNLMLQKLYKQVNKSTKPMQLVDIYHRGSELNIYKKSLGKDYTDEEFKLYDRMIKYERDFDFTASGLEAFLSKYSKSKNGIPIELPQHAFMLMAMDVFSGFEDRDTWIYKAYTRLSCFHITLPSPEMNALRTESNDHASCCLIKTGDSLDSWNEASKALVLHTAASAGVGDDISEVASIGDKVKNGRIVHGGKVPVLKSVDADIQKAVQNGRRGSATPFINFYDPEIITIMGLKSPRTDIAKRINDLSYGIKIRDLVYERAMRKQPISLFSNRIAPELYEVFHSGTAIEFKTLYEKLESESKYYKQIDAREFFDIFNTEALENSAYYLLNIDEVNSSKPFTETIYQANICMEEVSPTKNLSHLREQEPDIAICVLGNINQGKVASHELEEVTELLVIMQTELMLRQNHPMKQANEYVRQYRSTGIGVSNHAFWLASNGLKYGSKEALYMHDEWMEHFQFGLMKASMNLAKKIGPAPRFFEYSKYAKGEMPIDRYKKTVNELVEREYSCDWKWLREEIKKHGMANIGLSMIPPSESSSVPSSQTSGLEPIKNLITMKETKSGVNPQFAPMALKLADKYDYAYDTKDITQRYLRNVAVTQKWIDKSISTNRFYNPELYHKSLVPLKQMHADLFYAKYYGVKSIYYTNTYIKDVENEQTGCEGGGCSV